MSDNTTASARNIGTLGATTRTFNDFVGSSDSSDYYRFSIDGTRNLRLALSGLSADADMDLRASNGTTILRKATRAGSQSESIDFDKLAAGTYYVRVYQGTGTANTNYQLSLSAQAVAPPVISDNTAATARNIGTLGAATLTFKDSVGSSDSSDYYRFNIDGTRKLRVALSGLSADADMELRASNGTSVLRSSVRTGSQSEAIDFDNFAAGTYYVRVYQGTSTANTNYQLALSAQAVASPVISITALNATRSEGNNGSTPFTFTVSRSNGTGSSTVSYAVSGAADGSYNAASGNDFIGGTLPSRVLSFAAGETSQTLTINVAGDTTVESNERFKVTLSSPTNATLGTTAAYGHINNDDNVQATLGLAAPQSALLATLKSRFDSATTRIAYDAAVNDANLYPSNSKYAGFNGECVSYVKRARTNLNFFWDNAKGGAGAAKGQNFHVDVIPMIGSAFVVSAANRDVPPYEAGSFGHTGIVRDVQVVRNNAGSNVTYSYSLKLQIS
jgi:surface antigen/uncharacterized protein (DUF2141 family)